MISPLSCKLGAECLSSFRGPRWTTHRAKVLMVLRGGGAGGLPTTVLPHTNPSLPVNSGVQMSSKVCSYPPCFSVVLWEWKCSFMDIISCNPWGTISSIIIPVCLEEMATQGVEWDRHGSTWRNGDSDSKALPVLWATSQPFYQRSCHPRNDSEGPGSASSDQRASLDCRSCF